MAVYSLPRRGHFFALSLPLGVQIGTWGSVSHLAIPLASFSFPALQVKTSWGRIHN